MPRQREFAPQDAVREATDLFRRQGFASTSVDDLVRSTGVARAGLYQEFGGKRGLFLRSLADYTDRRDTDLEQRLTRPGSPLANLRSVLAEATEPQKRRDCLVTTSATEFGDRDPDVSRLVSASWSRAERAFAACLAAAQEQGEVGADVDPRAWARTLVVVMQGLRVIGRGRPRPALVADTLTTLLGALGKPA